MKSSPGELGHVDGYSSQGVHGDRRGGEAYGLGSYAWFMLLHRDNGVDLLQSLRIRRYALRDCFAVEFIAKLTTA